MDGDALNYVVEDKILAEILGRNNFSTKESAILELVKNAYDAGSEKLQIIFKKSSLNDGKLMLTIKDKGSGMNESDIRNAWMHVGKSTRGYKDIETSRVYSGSKGIGRFALARLGENVSVISKKEDSVGIVWVTDWDTSKILLDKTVKEIGTEINICNLRDKWSSRSIKPLQQYLNRVYFDNKMSIEIRYESDKIEKVEEHNEIIWKDPKIGINFVDSISFKYNSENQKLTGNIESDEFKDTVLDIINIPIKGKNFNINILDYLKKDILELIHLENEEIDIQNFTDNELINIIKNILNSIGDFSGNLYFSLNNISKDDIEKFEYKHSKLSERYKYGVILYRNAFSIDSFEGRNDWLKLSSRANSSPAAATHLTGSWRVRASQLSGYILIDKEKNKLIEDISNRQGIVENIYYKILIKIIHLALKEFESYRQSIIREIVRYKDNSMEEILEQNNSDEAEKIINAVIDNPEKIKDLTKDDFEKIQIKMNIQQHAVDIANDDKQQIEQNYRYETQLLNVLATSQLKISSLGHEVHNNRNTIVSNPAKIEEILKKKYDWIELKHVSPYSENIPYLLETLKEDLVKILNLADSILEESQKENFEIREYKLDELIDKVINKWKEQYSWITFIIEILDFVDIRISFDYMMIIFDNLILNSIQKNEKGSTLVISIQISYLNGVMKFNYSDNGLGLDSKYIENPMMILEPHESTRENGHGLGMWMVNNTITKLDGKIENIDGKNGFKLSGYIKVDGVINHEI